MSDAKAQLPSNEFSSKKSLKHILQSIFHKDSRKKNNKNKKDEIEVNSSNVVPIQPVAPTAQHLLEDFERLSLKKKGANIENENCDNLEDELKKFTVKTININEECRIGRYNSNSSEDSGFSERTITRSKSQESLEDVVESINELKLDDEAKEEKEDGKKKRIQTVFVSRGPVRNNLHCNLAHPYQQVT